MERAERAKHIAIAFMHIARANHYMVGFVAPVKLEELELARQILIIKENQKQTDIVRLALSMLEDEIKGYKL